VKLARAGRACGPCPARPVPQLVERTQRDGLYVVLQLLGPEKLRKYGAAGGDRVSLEMSRGGERDRQSAHCGAKGPARDAAKARRRGCEASGRSTRQAASLL
jgi:hypothetical protein